MGKENQMCVLVMSCDKYSDAWKVFFTLFFRYWEDCSYPVILCTETKVYEDARVKTIKTGLGMTWCGMLIEAIRQIPEENVLLLQEDFLVNKKVDTAAINKLMQVMENYKAGFMRIFPCPGPSSPFKDLVNIGEFTYEDPWRVSCQATIWRKSALLEIVEPQESIQQFEVNGTVRSLKSNSLYLGVSAVSSGLPDYGPYPFTYIATGIIQRRWTRRAANFLKCEGIPIDLSNRGIESYWTNFYRRFQFRKSRLSLIDRSILHVMDFVAHRIYTLSGLNIREHKKMI